MGNRFLDPNLFDEDWFLELSGQEMYFWVYICLKCDHAGIWRPNFKSFELITGFRINQDQFLTKCNSGQKRIMVLENKKWWLTGFIKYQYCRNQYEINPNHPVQKSAISQLENNQVDYKSMNYKIRVQDLSLTLKEKEKEKDSYSSKEGKKEKNNIFDDSVEKIYAFYPGKDLNNNNRSTGKGFKNKEQINKLLKTGLTEDVLIKTIEIYFENCRSSGSYLKNFSTFLNNLPDYDLKNEPPKQTI